MTSIYPRKVSIMRSRTAAAIGDPVGDLGYSGMQQVSAPTAGEDVLFSDVPASIQAGPTGRKKDSSLPADAVWAPSWYILIPKRALAKGAVRDRDLVIDDEGYRYQVAQAYWNILGHNLACIRLEA